MNQPVLRIDGLKTWFHTDDAIVRAVDGVSFDVAPGRTLGVVGESGSGKSVTALSVMRLLPKETALHPEGAVALLGKDLLGMRESDVVSLRGAEMSMIFQEPMTSLNPVLKVGDQVAEAIVRHETVSWADARARTVELFDEVGIPDPARRIDSYPHEMSGGQKQRVMIAMALACNPKLLIADEPTTALDVTIQKQILDLLRSLQEQRDMAMLFITHDLGVVGELAHDVAVMYRGHLVEYGDVLSVFKNPKHPYTKGLLACRPQLDTDYTRLPTVSDFMDDHTPDGGELHIVEKTLSESRLAELTAHREPHRPAEGERPLLQVRGLKVWFPVAHSLLGRPTEWVKAVDGIDFDIYKGQTLGLVGESGCGKTTTGRALLHLIEPTEGTCTYDGIDLAFMSQRGRGQDIRAMRRRLQIIFQDPYSSLNPRHTVEEILTEPMIVHELADSVSERRDRAASLLEEVGLGAEHLRRYPNEFSGGQRQRICIARALSVEPELIVCDESVSALDVSVQAQVLNLLRDLQSKRGLTYLFISHDLSVVKFMSDWVCVMKAGEIVESGTPDHLYGAATHPYTRSLISAIPDGSVEAIERRLGA